MSIATKKFFEIGKDKRIWAIGSIHGNLSSIINIHKHIFNNFNSNDIIIYLGNVIGVGEHSTEVVSEIIRFRLNIMAEFKIDHQSIVFLRGAQEEMLSKLLELQISPNPKEVLLWMFDHGVNKTLISYKINVDEILNISDSGSILISKWTTKVKNQIEKFDGHKEFYTNLLHAAFSASRKILFVNRGVDISRPLSAQNDCLWWGYHGFSEIRDSYYNFIRIVRGYDTKRVGPQKDSIVCSLYKGSGFGKNIIAGLFLPSGDIIELFEA